MAAGRGDSPPVQDEEFVITRVVDAPRDLVFKAWTELEHLKRWWGPKNLTWHQGTLDLRPGGLFHSGMRAPNGSGMWGKFVFREVVAPQRLAFIVSFSDEEGNTVRAPFSPTWPLEVLNVVTFSEQDGRTTITLRGRPINATAAERATFAAGHASMRQGFGGTLDQLSAHLASLPRSPR